MCNTNSRRGGGCLHSLFHFTPTLNLDFPSPPVENTSLNLLSSIGDHQTSRSTNYWELLEIIPNHIDQAVTIYLSVRHTGHKALRTLIHSTPLVQNRSFKKLWNLGKTSARFCLAKPLALCGKVLRVKSCYMESFGFFSKGGKGGSFSIQKFM